jgi:metallophosphoesterase superfamily enzyme
MIHCNYFCVCHKHPSLNVRTNVTLKCKLRGLYSSRVVVVKSSVKLRLYGRIVVEILGKLEKQIEVDVGGRF